MFVNIVKETYQDLYVHASHLCVGRGALTWAGNSIEIVKIIEFSSTGALWHPPRPALEAGVFFLQGRVS